MPEDTPYDPYIPSGSTPQTGAGATPQTGASPYANLERELEDTTKIMKKNVDTLYERGGRLEDVSNKTENLAQQSQLFRTGANKVRKQMWWKDMKMRVCLIIGIIVLILIIVLPVVLTVNK